MKILSVKSIKGNRDYMEDRYSEYIFGDTTVIMLCDGHGGAETADKTCNYLPKIIAAHIEALATNITNLEIAEKLRDIIMHWGAQCRQNKSGSTLTGVVLKNNTLFIYNIGDSRTCVHLEHSTRVYFLEPLFTNGKFNGTSKTSIFQTNFFCTFDHDLDSPLEINRLKQTKAFIENGRLNGILSLTRALGDKDVDPGLSYTPDIYWLSATSLTGPILLISDGVYESLQNNHQMYHIAKGTGAHVLVTYAYNQGSNDNITAVVAG